MLLHCSIELVLSNKKNAREDFRLTELRRLQYHKGWNCYDIPIYHMPLRLTLQIVNIDRLPNLVNRATHWAVTFMLFVLVPPTLNDTVLLSLLYWMSTFWTVMLEPERHSENPEVFKICAAVAIFDKSNSENTAVNGRNIFFDIDQTLPQVFQSRAFYRGRVCRRPKDL